MTEFGYIGKKPECGCIVAVVVDMPGMEKATGRDVAGFIKDGLIVERVSLEPMPVMVHRCPHGKPTAVVTHQETLL